MEIILVQKIFFYSKNSTYPIFFPPQFTAFKIRTNDHVIYRDFHNNFVVDEYLHLRPFVERLGNYLCLIINKIKLFKHGLQHWIVIINLVLIHSNFEKHRSFDTEVDVMVHIDLRCISRILFWWCSPISQYLTKSSTPTHPRTPIHFEEAIAVK